jgi:TorA maturation chaperone TorD
MNHSMNPAAPQTTAFSPSALSGEDRARAEFYAVLGRLLIAAPDAALLAALGGAPLPDGEQPMVLAWRRLALASRTADAAEVAQEYTDLFIGVGKTPCNLHASYWVRDATPRPLVAVRASLAELGLARLSASAVYEDHLGALCETMRMLVAGAPDRAPAPASVQRDFFERHLASWAIACCKAISECGVANYYLYIGQFGCEYLAIERDLLAIG